jgi:acyl-CoA thioester hydrolase
VRYAETDRMGLAYHAHYLVWFETGRTELMRAIGCPYVELEDRHGIFFPVVEVGAKYVAPARYDEQLDLRTRVTRVGGARVRFEYRLTRDDRTELARGFTEHAAVGSNGRPMRLPRELRERLLETESAS